jgi:hypothetical protein
MALTHDEYWRLGSDRLEYMHGKVSKLISMFPSGRRELVQAMMDGPIGVQFMSAPASTRRAYHNAFPCGLVAHSLNVVAYALKLTETLAPHQWLDHKVVFCALFHDLGKAGSPGRPYYVPTAEDWKARKGEYWDVSKHADAEFMPNAEKSLFTLQQHGIVLDHEETVAIRWNDGPGASGNGQYAFHEPDLALIIHWADFWSSKREKSEGFSVP